MLDRDLDEEVQLYDFSWEVGKTVKFQGLEWEITEEPELIQLLDGNYYQTIPHSGGIIRGIGHLYGVFYFVDALPKLYNTRLGCFTRSGQMVYQYAPLQSCDECVRLSAEEASTDVFSVYPNPVKEALHIDTDRVSVSYEVYDTAGNLIKVGNVNENTVSVAELLPAVYLISFSQNGTRLYSGRFVKE